MLVIDLTHPICENMPCFPGDEAPAIAAANTCERDGFNQKRFALCTHTGTHADASAICALLGGGGPRAAAGATVPGGIGGARRAVMDAIARIGVAL